MTASNPKAPFPYFGGKSRVADLVWSRLGDVSNFVEPFCGSAAVLLQRPHPPKIETVNDYDCMIANFWRATKCDPEGVAEWADGPVNECQLHAVHRWLVLGEDAAEFRRRMRTDMDFYDAKVAGLWCWGSCCWIGSGWCSTPESVAIPKLAGGGKKTATTSYGGALVHADVIPDVSVKRPKLSGGSPDSGALGTGVHAGGPDLPQKRPRAHRAAGSSNSPCNLPGVLAGDIEPGVSSKRPKLSGGSPDSGALGTGVHAGGPKLSEQRPALGDCRTSRFGRGVLGSHEGPSDSHRPQLADAYARGRGVHGNDSAGTCAARRAWLLDWFGRLRDRLRTVRVCCGDWRRVCDSPSVTTRLGLTGIFLDPPYSKTRTDGSANRAADLYANDRAQDVNALVADVRAYCLERGADPLMRLCLAGYAGEGHEVLESHGWSVVEWRSSGGYANRNRDNVNAARERLWFSPACIDPEDAALPLFPAKDAP